jgi:AraC-like DNA-binding protein
MKRNGFEQFQTNGHGSVNILFKHGEEQVNNGESHVVRKIGQSVSYMLQHLDQPLHVATLAAIVSFSPSHYSALFKRWMGCPPIDYFIHLRMRHACWLFDNTSLNVKEVAAALGYDDPFYFSRAFKSVNQVAPSEYRVMADKLKNTAKSAALPLPSSIPENGRTVRAVAGRRTQMNGRAESKPKGCAATDSNFVAGGEKRLKQTLLIES